jgi:hypothetical protein
MKENPMRIFALTSCLAALVSTTVSAATFPVENISPDAKWVAHLDFDELKNTKIGRILIDKLNREKLDAKFNALKAMFNIDPRSDLNTATFYGSGSEPVDAVALIDARFDEDHLVTLVAANDDYVLQSHGSHAVHSWVDDKKGVGIKSFGCFHSSGTLVLSQGLGNVRNALDILDAKSRGLAESDPLGKMITDESSMFFIAVANLAEMKALDPSAAMLRQSAAAHFSVGESEDRIRCRLRLTTKDEESAEMVGSVLQGMIAFTLLNAAEEPEIAKLADDATYGVTGNQVELIIEQPVTDVAEWLQDKIDEK